MFSIASLDLDDMMLSEISQTETSNIWFHLHVESNKWIKGTKQKTKIASDVENQLVIAKGKGWGMVKQMKGIKRYKL